MRFLRSSLNATFAGVVLSTTACHPSATAPSADEARASREWVTGAAAAALGPDGRFVLPLPAAPGPREIGEAAARAQAVAWARSIATTARSGTAVAIGGGLVMTDSRTALEQAHGGAIDFAALSDCGRTSYAESPFGPIPERAEPSVHNAFGPYWVVRLCAGDGEVPVVLAVAANSDYGVEGGRLQAPPHQSGNEFQSWGLPHGTGLSRALPLEPEAAAGVAFRATGRRVSEVPVFVWATMGIPPTPIVAQCGYWRLTLEAPVRGTGATSGAAYETRQLRIWREACAAGDTTLFVALAAQPDTALHLVYDVFVDLANGRTTRRDSVRVPVRSPYLYEPIRLVVP